jgi:hypothetical protein
MTYQHLSQEERYQIYILMKDGKTQSQIATLMDRHKSTISRELARNMGLKGYRPKQACLLAEERSLGSRNAVHINPKDWDMAVTCLHKKWSPEQIADQVVLAMKRFTAMCTRIKPLAAVFGSSCVAKRNARSAMPVAAIGGARLWVEGRLASDPSILKPDPKSVTGKAIR